MEYDSKSYNNILTNFRKGRAWLNDVSVEIKGGENELPPLTLLRAYEEEPTIDNTLALASEMVMNKEVVFKHQGKEILVFTYNGGDLSDKFAKSPYLLDMLLKLCYGLMVKKLTPPSEGSENEEMR